MEAAPKMLFHLGNTQLTNYTSLELLIGFKSHDRTELWTRRNRRRLTIYTPYSKEMDYNGDSTKSRVSFVTLALNREHLRKTQMTMVNITTGFFIQMNNGNFEYIKITGALELMKAIISSGLKILSVMATLRFSMS